MINQCSCLFTYHFRFPPNNDHHAAVERRDSIFCGPADISKFVNIRQIPNVTPSDPFTTPIGGNTTCSTLTPGTAQEQPGQHSNVASVAISSSALLGSAPKATNLKPRATPVSSWSAV